MSGWDEVLKEISESKTQQDSVREKYIKALFDYTGRNIIAYYSGWLKNPRTEGCEISDSDMTGFMNCVHGLDCSKGLDLILHTPGGSPAAAEGIVHYLRTKFNNDIRVIVPQLAMSAGTMIACAGKEILLGKQSNLGPIDPQFNGIPAYNIKKEFEDAKEDLRKNPQNAQYWAIKLQQYPAAFMKTAIDAIELSGALVEEWLGSCMFDKNCEKDKSTISEIVKKLNQHDESMIHGRHFSADFCKSIGLKIVMIEDDNILQDRILSLHHAYMITIDTTQTLKIIENQQGKKTILLNRGGVR